MATTQKSFVISAFTRVMRPLVRIMLRNGVTFGELAEVLKRLYVESAGIETRETSTAPSTFKISILTGLSNTEVQRLLTAPPLDPERLESHVDRVGRALATWHESVDFTGPYGLPLELPLERKTEGPSFTRLALRAGIFDCSPAELLNELLRVGAAVQLQSGAVRVVARSYLPRPTDPAALEFMTAAFTDLAETLDHNVSDEHTQKYFERRVWSPLGVPQRLVGEFQSMVDDLGQQLLESLDTWITRSESKSSGDEKTARVGFAMYYFQRQPQ